MKKLALFALLLSCLLLCACTNSKEPDASSPTQLPAELPSSGTDVTEPLPSSGTDIEMPRPASNSDVDFEVSLK